MKMLYLSVMLAVLSCGCAALRVDVSMYTGPVPVPFEVARSLADAVAQEPIFNASTRATFKEKVLGQIKTVVVTANTAAFRAAGKPDSVAKQQAEGLWGNMRPGFAGEWEQSVGAPAARVKQTLAALESAFVATQPLTGAAVRSYYDLRAALGAYSARFRGFRKKVEDFLESQIKELERLQRQDGMLAQAARAKRESEETMGELSADRVSGIASSSAVTGRHVGYPIFDPGISGLSRESTDWVDFGKTRFSANGGNAQFVVIQEGLLVFRKKSLDFDPTAVIGAGTALTRVGLKVAAALASGATGLPISSIANVALGTSEGGESQEATLVVNQAELAAAARLLKRRALAKQEYLEALADLYERATKPDAKLDELQKEFERITNFYQARTRSIVGNQP